MVNNNPFFHRGPIHDPAYFCDRRHETSQVLELLRKGQSVSIIGPRRIGKTSLLFHLSNPSVFQQFGISSEQCCFIYINCGGWSLLDVNDFYTLMLGEIDDSLAKVGHNIVLTRPPAVPIRYRTLYQIIKDLDSQQIQLIFLLDEFEALSNNPNLNDAFFSSLRALVTNFNVACVTASTKSLLELTYAEKSTLDSPFFSIFAPIRLRLFDRTEARALLSNLSSLEGIAFSPHTIDFLLKLAGPHPLFLQIAGYHASGFKAVPSAPLDSTDLDQVRLQFLAEAKDHWQSYWDHLTLHDQRCLALLPVASQSDTMSIQRLAEMGLVLEYEGKFLPLSGSFQEFVGRQKVEGLLQEPPIALEPEQRIVLLRGQSLQLSPTQFDVLRCLMEHAGQIVGHQELEECVWPDEYIEDPARLRDYIKTLRSKLGNDADCIENVRGIGYKFSPTL